MTWFRSAINFYENDVSRFVLNFIKKICKKKEVKISINWYQINSEHSWNGKFQKKEKPLRQNVYSRVHFMGNERAFIAKITDI